MLILLRGKPGTGKSTVADGLGRKLGAAVIDKDDIKDVLDSRYRDEYIGGLCYEVMLKIAERCLTQGLHVICDSPLTFADLHACAREMAARHGTSVRTVRLVCSDEAEWRRRIEARQGMPEHRVTEFTHTSLRKEEQYVDPDELVVDTAGSLESALDAILHFVQHDTHHAQEMETARV